LGFAEYRRFAAGILAVTAADVQRVARTHLDWSRAVIAVVKPEEATPGAIKRQRAGVGHGSGGAGTTRAARATPPVPVGSE
jgi:hypothetical protein